MIRMLALKLGFVIMLYFVCVLLCENVFALMTEIFEGYEIRRFFCKLKSFILKKKQWLKETMYST